MLNQARTKLSSHRLAIAILLLIVAIVPFIHPTYSSFGAQKPHANDLASGTVIIADNLVVNSRLNNIINMKPGDTQSVCINVAYTGSLPANVKMYFPSATGNNLGRYITFTVTRGTLSSPNGTLCDSFTPDATNSEIYRGNLAAFPTTYATGVSDLNNPIWGPGNTTPDVRAYKLNFLLQNNNAAQGLTVGKHIAWEARNT